MAAIPLAIGLLIGGATVPAAWLIAASALFGFLSHYAIVPWASRAHEGKPAPPGYAARRVGWGASYLALAASCFAGALISAPSAARVPLLAIAAAAGALAAFYASAAILGAGRAVVAEAIGMIGMALTAPMMAVAAGVPMTPRVFASSVLALSYFLSSLAYVRSYDGVKAGRGGSIAACLAAHMTLLAALAAAATTGWLPRLWWLPWVPIAARTAIGLLRPPVNLRALGLRELWVAVGFTALAAVALSRLLDHVGGSCELPPCGEIADGREEALQAGVALVTFDAEQVLLVLLPRVVPAARDRACGSRRGRGL